MPNPLQLEKYEHMLIGETMRLLRKDILDMTLSDVGKHLSKSLSMIQQVERGARVLRYEDLGRFVELFPAANRKALFDLLVRKTVIKVSTNYGLITKDNGKYLNEKNLEIIRSDFRSSSETFKSLGACLDVNGAQIKKILHGEMALNRKQLVALAEGLNANPERYLFAGGHVTDAMDNFVLELSSFFDALEKYKSTDDPVTREMFMKTLNDAIKTTL
jgi:transcriptional regulator with XRE-family HTH domain